MSKGEIHTRQLAEPAGGGGIVLEAVVRCTEIDVNGHVNNAKYVDYLEWGREE